MGACRTLREVRLVPLADLVRMKLTSFRETHVEDLDEAGLSPVLREWMMRVRARE